jgi:hypothetical protein
MKKHWLKIKEKFISYLLYSLKPSLKKTINELINFNKKIVLMLCQMIIELK